MGRRYLYPLSTRHRWSLHSQLVSNYGLAIHVFCTQIDFFTIPFFSKIQKSSMIFCNDFFHRKNQGTIFWLNYFVEKNCGMISFYKSYHNFFLTIFIILFFLNIIIFCCIFSYFAPEIAKNTKYPTIVSIFAPKIAQNPQKQAKKNIGKNHSF